MFSLIIMSRRFFDLEDNPDDYRDAEEGGHDIDRKGAEA